MAWHFHILWVFLLLIWDFCCMYMIYFIFKQKQLCFLVYFKQECFLALLALFQQFFLILFQHASTIFLTLWCRLHTIKVKNTYPISSMQDLMMDLVIFVYACWICALILKFFTLNVCFKLKSLIFKAILMPWSCMKAMDHLFFSEIWFLHAGLWILLVACLRFMNIYYCSSCWRMILLFNGVVCWI